MKAYLIFFGNESLPNLKKMEDNFNLFANGRRPQVFDKEEDLNFLKMEDDKKN
jgi:hypothetical protein